MAVKTVDIVANISNNLLKGLMAGKTLLALQGSARAGKTYNVTIFLIMCCTNMVFFNNVRRVWLEAKKKKEAEKKKRDGQEVKDIPFVPKDKILVSIVRLASPSLKRSVYRDFKEIMINMGLWDERRMNKTEMVYTFENGSQMEFFATADNEQKVRGSKRDVLFVNEANEITEWEFSQLRMRTEDFSIVDFNPSFTEEHWLFAMLHDDRTHHFISTFEHNPFLSEAIKEEIYSYQQTNPALWQIFGLGQFAIVEGLVFPKENWDICKFEQIPDGLVQRIGIDVGFSGKGDPTAAVRCFYGNINGVKHMWLHQLVYEQGLSEKSLAYRLKMYQDIPKFIDSGNPLFIRNLIDSGCQNVKGVTKYANSVIDGLTAMMGYKIHITNTSVDIIKEFQNYVWLKDREDKYTNTPIDKWNHCFTAETLISTVNGPKPIVDIHPGDEVYTSGGVHTVVKKFENGVQEVYDFVLTLSDGKTIIVSATKDHGIITGKMSDEKTPIGQLMPGDVVRYIDEEGVKLACIEIITISNLRYAKTYNFMVETVHNYYANGLLSSNCVDAVRYSTMQDRSARFHGVNASKRRYNKADLGLRF